MSFIGTLRQHSLSTERFLVLSGDRTRGVLISNRHHRFIIQDASVCHKTWTSVVCFPNTLNDTKWVMKFPDPS